MTLGFEITVPGLEDLLYRLTRYDSAVNKHFKRAMKKTTIAIESVIKPEVPVGVSGALKNSIGSEITEEGPGSVVGRIGSSLKDEVYPQVMEFGRAPGTNISSEGMESLTRWVHVKRIAGVYSVKTHKRKGKKATQHDQDRQAAYMIALAIFRHGIKGRHFMQKGFEAGKPRANEYFTQAIEDIVLEVANGS
jgi:hypothetical protein